MRARRKWKNGSRAGVYNSRRGFLNEPGVYVSFEETKDKIERNISSLGIEPKKLIRQNKLYIDYIDSRQGNNAEVGEFELTGLFIRLERAINKVKAKRVVIDGSEALFGSFANQHIIRREFARLFQWLDSKGVTSLVTGEKGEGTLTRHGLEEYLADCVLYLDHHVHDQLSTFPHR